MIASSFRDQVAKIMAFWHGDHSDRRSLAEVLSLELAPKLAKADWTVSGQPTIYTSTHSAGADVDRPASRVE